MLLLALGAAQAAGAQVPGQLPEPDEAIPAVGEKAPDFTLPDTHGKPVTLSQLWSQPLPAAGKKRQPWVLLIFYRGYW